jgi:hypothetical protein
MEHECVKKKKGTKRKGKKKVGTRTGLMGVWAFSIDAFTSRTNDICPLMKMGGENAYNRFQPSKSQNLLLGAFVSALHHHRSRSSCHGHSKQLNKGSSTKYRM